MDSSVGRGDRAALTGTGYSQSPLSASHLDTWDPWRDIGDVWDGYSTRQAADFVGLPESTVRRCVRDGVIAEKKGAVSAKISFRDLSILKAVKQLMAEGVPLKRVRRQLGALKKRLPDQASLAGVSLIAHGGHVIVREQTHAWRADNGQMVFDFQGESERGHVHAMPVRHEVPGPEPVIAMNADEWFEKGVSLEERDTERAIDAYERALRLRPDSTETWINLGRLYAETGHTEQASACFGEALAVDPADATAIYNLGVVSQDAGRDLEAAEFYERALQIDPELAEAHYNLATIFDRNGDPRAAIRHINEYRKLTRG